MSPIRIAILATDGVFAATLMQARDFFHMAGLRHGKQQGLGPTSACQIRVGSPDGQAASSFSGAVIPGDGSPGEAGVVILPACGGGGGPLCLRFAARLPL